MNGISKILKELRESPGNRERFNKMNRIEVTLDEDGEVEFGYEYLSGFDDLSESARELVVRVALSRYENEAVIECFGRVGGDTSLVHVFYRAFDEPLQRGESFNEAIAKLGNAMETLNLL